MSNAQKNEAQADVRRMLGIIFLLLAFVGLYWAADAIIQLWNSPRNVAFVSIFIELLEENQLPIIKSREGAEINLPASWPVVVGIFLSIVLISSVGVLVKLLLSNSILLLFPELRNDKGIFSSSIKRNKE